MLAITGGSAWGAGADTILGAPYASILVDLVAGPDNWYLVRAAPGERGIVCAALEAGGGRERRDQAPELVWAAGEHALVVVDGPDGVRRLEERIDGAAARTLARGVDRIECSTSAQDPVGVPPGAVRVRLWLHRRDAAGGLQQLAVERLVRLENG